MPGNANSGDRNAPGKRAKHAAELASTIRKAIMDSLADVDKGPKKVKDYLIGEFKANPLRFIEAAAKFMPKEVNQNVRANIQHTHTVESVSETHSWVAGLLESDTDDAASKSRPN